MIVLSNIFSSSNFLIKAPSVSSSQSKLHRLKSVENPSFINLSGIVFRGGNSSGILSNYTTAEIDGLAFHARLASVGP